jgi:ABC-type glycerol-3-phosphate transport system permease component
MGEGFSLRRPANLAALIFLIAACVFALMPVLWAFSTAFKIPQEVRAVPASWIPDQPTIDNWSRALLSGKFLRYLLNTLLVVGGSLVLSLALAVHAAWATVRFRFFGRDFSLLLMWATIMIPGVSIIVPLYLVTVDVGIYDTLFALILVYSAWLVPTLTWLLRGFVASVPVEIEEAARMDGCSTLGAFYRVCLPLTWPGLIAGSILVFVMIWNEFLIGYSLTLSDDNRLIQVGIYYFITDIGVQYGPLMASAILSVLPVLFIYAVLQRHFISGLTAGAVRG